MGLRVGVRGVPPCCSDHIITPWRTCHAVIVVVVLAVVIVAVVVVVFIV